MITINPVSSSALRVVADSMLGKMQKDQRLIVFFIPPKKIVNGGILSIFSICKTSRQFKNIHKSEVILATYPGSKSYRKNDLFENNETIYSFDEIVKRGTPKSLLLHVPEYASMEVFLGLKNYADYLKTVPDLWVNIMTQNILMLQKPVDLANWLSLTTKLTQTTAHDKYSTQETADLYSLPTHHLSVYNDPSQYKKLPYEKKQDLIALSPDKTEKKELIVNELRKQLPSFEIITIQNMRYEDYKDLIARAKFVVTFGEGFDGYYIEAFFSGGITFAVYNDNFFPDKQFSKFENTYSSYEEMLSNITGDMKSLDDKSSYEKVVRQNLDKIAKLYDFSTYTKNLENFYRHEFTYNPSPDSAKRLIADILAERDRLLEEKAAAIAHRDKAIEEQAAAIVERDRAIEEQGAAIAQRDKVISDLLNSRSWRVTKPLRGASAALKRKRR